MNPTSCAAKGIDPQHLGQGTCVAGGMTVTILNKNSTLHLKSLTAMLDGSHTANSVSSDGGTAVANGEFVIFSLTITNQLDSPQSFDSTGVTQTLLELNGKQYTENFRLIAVLSG
ncbi:MAG: hypothetical protein ACLP0J_08980 [Solirubrobacteraceae bacterium]